MLIAILDDDHDCDVDCNKGYVLYFGEKALVLVWLVFAEDNMMSNSFETMTVIVFSVDAKCMISNNIGFFLY